MLPATDHHIVYVDIPLRPQNISDFFSYVEMFVIVYQNIKFYTFFLLKTTFLVPWYEVKIYSLWYDMFM